MADPSFSPIDPFTVVTAIFKSVVLKRQDIMGCLEGKCIHTVVYTYTCIYIYIYNCRQYCFGLLGLISAVPIYARVHVCVYVCVCIYRYLYIPFFFGMFPFCPWASHNNYLFFQAIKFKMAVKLVKSSITMVCCNPSQPQD